MLNFPKCALLHEFFIIIFRNYFQDCFHLKVPGRLFPIEEFYLEDILLKLNYTTSTSSKTSKKAKSRNIGHGSKTQIPSEECQEFFDIIKQSFTTGEFEDVYSCLGEFDINLQVRDVTVCKIKNFSANQNFT